MKTYKIENVYLKEAYVVTSKLESEGPIGKFFDEVFTPNEDCFESSELKMLKKCLSKLSISNIDLVVAGDLSNQIAISNYTAKLIDKPMLGVYAACATINEAIIIASLLIESDKMKNILCFTSSYNQTAERQFRSPIEYGGEKSLTQTFTSTVAAGCIISSKKSIIKITNITIGKVFDIDFKNVLDFGRCMAPAAIETLLSHFKNTNTKPSDYDLILTGDLSHYGYPIVKNELEKVFGTINNYNDTGIMIFDRNNQNVFAGGSGPGTIAATLLGYVYKKMLNKELKKVLICATGALMNPIMSNQKREIPSIAHIIELGVEL